MLRLARALPRAGRLGAALPLLLAAALAAGAADAQRRSTFERDTGFLLKIGGWSAETLHPTAEACRDACLAEPRCAVWSFGDLPAGSPKKCTRADGYQTKLRIAGHFTGVVGAAPQAEHRPRPDSVPTRTQRSSTFEVDVAFNGDVYSIRMSYSAADCRAQCLSEPDAYCKAWSWRPPGAPAPNQCTFFKSHSVERLSRPGYVAGIVTGTAGPGADPGTAGLSFEQINARCAGEDRSALGLQLAACNELLARGLTTRNQAIVHANKGSIHRKLRQYELATREIDRSFSLDPSRPATWAIRGDLLRDTRRFRQALDAFDRSLQLHASASPTDPYRQTRVDAVYRGRGLTHAQMGNWATALPDFDRCIAIYPVNQACWHERGMVRIALKQFQLALTDFDEAIRLRPRDGASHYERGIVHRALGNAAQAQQDFAAARRFGYRPPANAR